MKHEQKQNSALSDGIIKIKEGQKRLSALTEDLLKTKVEDLHFNALSDGISKIKQGQKRLLALTDEVLNFKHGQLLPFQHLVKKEISINWKEYFDNGCKGEDMWGHYKTSNGDLYVVIDGASNHEGTKTGADVVRLINDRFKKDAAKIEHIHDLKELIHTINTESTRINEGAYAAIAGILHSRNKLYSFGAGDVSIIAKKPNGKLIQILPLDLNMHPDAAEELAKTEIGTIVDGIEITEENYKQRVNQYIHHGLFNAIGFGKEFFLHEKNFNAKDGAAILIATDGVTDSFMEPQREAGKISMEDALKIHKVINSSSNAMNAAEALSNLIWDTQVKEKKKIKPDDRTGLFLYMNHITDSQATPEAVTEEAKAEEQ